MAFTEGMTPLCGGPSSVARAASGEGLNFRGLLLTARPVLVAGRRSSFLHSARLCRALAMPPTAPVSSSAASFSTRSRSLGEEGGSAKPRALKKTSVSGPGTERLSGAGRSTATGRGSGSTCGAPAAVSPPSGQASPLSSSLSGSASQFSGINSSCSGTATMGCNLPRSGSVWSAGRTALVWRPLSRSSYSPMRLRATSSSSCSMAVRGFRDRPLGRLRISSTSSGEPAYAPGLCSRRAMIVYAPMMKPSPCSMRWRLSLPTGSWARERKTPLALTSSR